MLELFKTKKNHFVGIDFGTASIKVVELAYVEQKTILENYGFLELDLVNRGNMKPASLEKILNESLKNLLAKMNIQNVPAFVAIPGFSGLVAIIELPSMPTDELTKAIQFEAHKYIPSALDEIALSWEVVGRVGGQGEAQKATEKAKEGNNFISKLGLKSDSSIKSGEKLKVLLVAAPKKDIEHYDRLVSGAGLEVKAIELETFSIARVLVGDEPGVFLIMDIGARTTNLILVEKGLIQANRNIDAGGEEITSAIMDMLSVSRSRAEMFKKEEKDILNGKEASLVVPILDLLVGELRRIIAAYKEKNKDGKIDAVILSGGTSKMIGIKEYFSHALGEEIQVGNPWRGVVVSDEVAGLTKELGASFAVALGLALRGVEEYKKK
jgi:type IV pilus assembly protein PilM